jgi:amino acid transporter
MSTEKKHVKLGEFFATAICGNDILSSALYVSGIAAIFAGVYAPLVLIGVALVLFFYKSVYREVVEALPVNGGAYNALLNGTSKTVAATAGVMTVLSYIATAVISAKTAVEYLFKFIEQLLLDTGSPIRPEQIQTLIIPAIIIVLFAFAMLVIAGVKDSAKVAAFIFGFHIFTLLGFIVLGFLSIQHGTNFSANLAQTAEIIAHRGGLPQTLFFAFSACLLGVSGFESSANFVEEQQKGVFKKTLRNMLIGVAVFNPLIALVVLNILPLSEIATAKDFLLAEAAYQIGGLAILGWIAINAFMVLCGAVLTSYVGVTGLVNRMSLDDCLPPLLAKENKNGSYPRIILAFFALCTSILLITKGDLLSLAGVYTISFLAVMTLFALGNLILRQTRSDLKRPYKAPFFFIIIAFFATAFGLLGNAIIDSRNVVFFLIYFVPAILIVYSIIYKKDLIKSLKKAFKFIVPVYEWLQKVYLETINAKFYVFIHHRSRLHNILEYISRNENGHNIVLVHCKNGDDGEKDRIEQLIPYLKEAGVYPDFNIEFEYIDNNFSPDVVDEFATRKGINKNRIFIGSIHEDHSFDYDELGGVRIIS